MAQFTKEVTAIEDPNARNKHGLPHIDHIETTFLIGDEAITVSKDDINCTGKVLLYRANLDELGRIVNVENLEGGSIDNAQVLAWKVTCPDTARTIGQHEMANSR